MGRRGHRTANGIVQTSAVSNPPPSPTHYMISTLLLYTRNTRTDLTPTLPQSTISQKYSICTSSLPRGFVLQVKKPQHSKQQVWPVFTNHCRICRNIISNIHTFPAAPAPPLVPHCQIGADTTTGPAQNEKQILKKKTKNGNKTQKASFKPANTSKSRSSTKLGLAYFPTVHVTSRVRVPKTAKCSCRS